MSTGTQLSGVPRWLSGTDVGETIGYEDGAMTTSCGAYDDDGTSKGFSIVNKS